MKKKNTLIESPPSDALSERIRKILKAEFPEDYIDISLSGIRDNIHVIVISRKFDKLKESLRQEYLWDVIDHSVLKEEEKQRISMILPLSPDNLR